MSGLSAVRLCTAICMDDRAARDGLVLCVACYGPVGADTLDSASYRSTVSVSADRDSDIVSAMRGSLTHTYRTG